MLDAFGRDIHYLRLSVTDRCNLRCRYCMPEDGAPCAAPDEVLRDDELLRIAAAAVTLGIDRFKITGGEPLLRPDCAGLVARLRALPGVRQVTLTTNGLLLPQQLDALCQAGLDRINISLDTLDNAQYQHLTRRAHTTDEVLSAIRLCAPRLPTRVNAVLLPETADQLIPLAELAQELPVDVRFIERMPLGAASANAPPDAERALDRLRARWPQLRPVPSLHGNGPARYFYADGLRGHLGLIDAVSHGFCDRCNRLRLTCTGRLKPCLCYAQGVELRPLLRDVCEKSVLREAIRAAILQKPAAHCFARREHITEHQSMNQIGG